MTAYLNGPDISAHNPSFPDLTGQDFIIMRACYGTQQDSKFTQWLQLAKRSGKVTGAYAFGRYGDGVEQADTFLRIAKDCELLFLDWEGDGGNRKMTEAQARAFIGRIKALGRKVGLYASESGYPRDSFGADYRWVANYSRKPRVAFDLWQYSGTSLDRSYFNGTQAQLYELAGRVTQQPLPEGEPMTNLFPITCRRVVDLPAGAVLLKSPGGDIYTHLTKAVTLGLLGATPTHFHVADGDAGVYVSRTGLATRTADVNVGA